MERNKDYIIVVAGKCQAERTVASERSEWKQLRLFAVSRVVRLVRVFPKRSCSGRDSVCPFVLLTSLLRVEAEKRKSRNAKEIS